MYKEFLIQAGLTPEQGDIYQALLKNGSSIAGKLSLLTGIKRSMVYKALSQLEVTGLVKKEDAPGKVARFSPAHPGALRELIEKKKQEIETVQATLQGSLGQMVSDFNLLSGKPNVQFYEGDAGVREVLDDSLYAKKEIYSYADIEAIEKYIAKANEKYVAEREKFAIKKKGLVLDTPFARERLKDYHPGITETKFLKTGSAPFNTIMQIYDNKVSYLTLSDKEKIGVIIEDPNIYNMHKILFEYLWSLTQEIKR
ncbi:MAG: hypothetical protein NT077_00070 [Candidatus Taylorbacteria bacterium]|nr:hypothetical protein [Candidatus Taylorbacteria bacterium]